ncbi:hypothetical protein DNK47_02065 [Mycoplasma wenyonii]|uniref:Uncharacterized protein n=1 Tax=Mycoplasma wenyonii TaxID=65123 RepID=A0A328PTC3_9MOLU|nr:hypothetical protein [Mycoplasma wenyonii]RAO94980.1 hypothetical protein DNK47_02065 [Mycoplasma wenyonii]
MTGLVKVLVGLGVAVSVAGVAGGTYVAVTKSNVATQETQLLRIELSSPTSYSDHSQQVVQGSEHAHQESQNLIDSRGTTVTHTSASQDNPDLKTQEQLAKEKETTTGNCIIIDPLKKILEVAKQDETEYYSVSCDNTRMGVAREGNIPNQWEGAFPKSIFKRQDLGNGQKLEIKVKEEDEDTSTDYDSEYEDWPFLLTFSGKSFVNTDNSLLSAKWNYYEDDSLDEERKVFARVKLTKPNSSKNIYLLWTQS